LHPSVTLCIERLVDAPEAAAVEPLLRAYVAWAADELATLGVHFDDVSAVVEVHHAAFRAELPNLVGPRGRLLVARVGPDAVGLGALKPVDATTAEIKRMYVDPQARGRGVGRSLLEHLLDAAHAEGFRVARLETLAFMSEAQGLYESLGFRDTPAFAGSEASLSGFEHVTRYMERR